MLWALICCITWRSSIYLQVLPLVGHFSEEYWIIFLVKTTTAKKSPQCQSQTLLIHSSEADYINSELFHFSCKDIVWWSEHNPGSCGFLQYWNITVNSILEICFSVLLQCFINILPPVKWRSFLSTCCTENKYLGLLEMKGLSCFVIWCCIKTFEGWIWQGDSREWSEPERTGFVWGSQTMCWNQRQNLPWPCASLQHS